MIEVARKRPIRQIQLEVTPNPSTVYREAPAGTSVAIIKAYIKDTSGSIDRVSLAEGESAAYFDIVQEDTDTRKWFLLTHKPVDKPVGFVFDLKTYGYNKGSIIDKQVQIKVIEKNLYAPSFDRTHYYFQAYRYARYTQFAIGGQVNIGSVVATDMDNQTYNSQFQYSIFDLDAVMLFQLDPQSGKITLIADFPEKVKNMTFNVTAQDTGSPPLMNHTMVTVTVSEVPAYKSAGASGYYKLILLFYP
ncbi:hypothetical protein CHS0354_033004 [Potamilus streckersoni]|uniref:Cadherin domain-containing protein n=1 Tax=Potamilus streckersoni TaxID=2493646 RepID=A0AAE0RX24_9BIVA|nr:hypothetical protein CHS0354_033004 [Potamilus streckersoni]